VDSYDVFLIQVHGRRRWRYARMHDERLVPGLPLKILQNFKHEHECVLEPGDMLYLPPLWSHEGDAVGECMTCSVGFRSPSRDELARELLVRMADRIDDESALAPGESPPAAALYRDPKQAATHTAGQLPAALRDYAVDAVRRQLSRPGALDLALGEYLTEPKAHVWFPPGGPWRDDGAVVLDARSHMLYDTLRIFLNGEAWQARGADAALMRRLADARRLEADELRTASAAARELLGQWMEQGWLRPAENGDE
jgi:50S ribosomal protein L16 3-hydroxylase